MSPAPACRQAGLERQRIIPRKQIVKNQKAVDQACVMLAAAEGGMRHLAGARNVRLAFTHACIYFLRNS